MFAALVTARYRLMQEVADANYHNDGTVKVDPVPLTDDWLRFDGGPFVKRNSGDDRARFKEAAVAAANRDKFVSNRNWNSDSPWNCYLLPEGYAHHSSATTLEGYDDWMARDSAKLGIKRLDFGWSGFKCKEDESYSLGSADKSAADWGYSGVPSFYEISERALEYTPDNADAGKRDPRLKFSIRLTRAANQQRTSSGTSRVRPAGDMAIYAGQQADNRMAAVATSEVYFERPLSAPRADGRTELASLFNPYWQVRLSGNSVADLAAALALQAGGTP
jgi:hypothetical protein